MSNPSNRVRSVIFTFIAVGIVCLAAFTIPSSWLRIAASSSGIVPKQDDEVRASSAINAKVAYQRGPNATSDIYTITPGSGIATGIRRGYHPSYSPDGTKIAFVDNTAGPTNGFIMLMNADGTNVRSLATPRQGFTPTWSPDGTRLAFIRGDFESVGDNGKGQLYVIDMTSGSEGANETLIPTTEQISKPTWGGSNRIAATCYLPRVGGGIDPLGICTTTTIPASSQIGSNPPTITRISGANTNDRDVSWSADGNFLAFISTRDYPMATASEIYQSNVTGTNVLRTTTVADFKTGPAWSPDGQKIVYSRNGTQGPNNATLRSVDASTLNAANPTVITNFGSGDTFPNWGSAVIAATPTPSPAPGTGNGKIAFERFTDSAGVTQIYTITDTAGATAAVCGGASETREGRRPAFSADGTKLAFMRAGTIWTSNADCSNQVSTGSAGDAPTWSPDGTKIAFVRGGSFSDIWTMNADGTNQVKLTDIATETKPAGSFSNAQPSWGSNNKIVFRGTFRKVVNGNLASVGDIWTMDAAGATFVRLTDDPVNAYAPDWSPDSSKVAFASNRATNRGEIFTMNADGTNQTRITTNASISNSNPAWSPDGLKIVHDDDFTNITRRNVDGSNSAVLTLGNFPDWQRATVEATPTPSPAPTHADVRISSVQDTPDPVTVGQTVTYQIFVNNIGPAPASNILVGTDPLPASVDFSPSGSSSFCSISQDRSVGCILPNALSASGAGSIVQVNVAVIPSQTGSISFGAVVAASQPDPDSSNNRATAQTTVIGPNAELNISLTSVSTLTPSVDREMTYKVWLRNLGPSASTNTVVRIQVPSNTFLIGGITGCTRVGTGRNYDCSLGTMAAATEKLYDVRVRPTAPGPISLFARVTSDTPGVGDRSVTQGPITVADVPRPPNDFLASAQPLTGEHVNVTGFNFNATIERANALFGSTGEVSHAGKAAGKSVWYLWQAPNIRGSVKISTAGSNFDTLLDVRELPESSPDLSELPVVGGNDDVGTLRTSEYSFRFKPETAYYIAVDGYGGATGDISLKIDVTPSLFLSERIDQKLTGFSPASACSSVSNLNDLFCGYKREPSTGFLLLTIRGQNFIPASKVLVDGQQPQGFDLNGNPVTGTTTFVSSSELLVRVPPNPPLLVERVAKAGVYTPVDVTSGSPDRNAPEGTVTAIAGQTAQIRVLDLKDATLAPGESAQVCGATLFNDPNVQTCMTMVHIGDNPITVSPTWFAALAYCDGVETNTDRRLQCAESMSNGRGWAVNPRPGGTPLGSIRFDTRYELPYGLAPPGITPQILGTGGNPAGLITDCSACVALVGQDGGTLIGNDGSTLIGNDGSTLIGNDGSTLIGNDGSTLIGNDGSTLIGNDGGTLIGNDGSTRSSLLVPNLMRRNASTGQGPTRPALPRSPGDLVTGNTGYMLIKGSGGSAPTVTYTTDDVTGRSYMNVSITLDNTSTPRISNIANMAFTVGMNPGVLKLQSSAITVHENAGFATVTVQRSGDTTAPASFEYTTVQNADVTSCGPGSPSGNGGEKCDFATTLGAFRFAANETTTDIRIPIVDDTYAEGSETFKLLIGNALGAAIDLPSAATITITDNDSVSGPANPLDSADAQFFVRQQYLDLLGREPSSAEMTAGTGPITLCGADAACRRTKAVDLSNTLFLQSQAATGYVFRLYRAAFGNDQPFPLPDTSNPAESKKWINYSAFSRDLGLMTDVPSLTQKKIELANSFVLRRAFTRKYSPIALNNGPAFVDAILATIRNDSGVDLVSQRSTLITAFEQAETLMEGRASVIYLLAESSQTNPVNNTAFVTAEDGRSFASALYNTYLKRDGDVAALGSVLTQLQGGTQRRALIDQFVYGLEYRQRFGPAAAQPVTVSGRVLTPAGIALRNATVSMTNQQGIRRTATTSSFGVFSFANVTAGETMTFSIASKRYRFSPRIIQIDGSNSTLADFIGLE